MSSVIFIFLFYIGQLVCYTIILGKGGIYSMNKDLFPVRLKELRKAKGITQKQLAENLGVSLPSVIHYENGQRFPVAGIISLMSQFFGVDRAYLCGETDTKEVEPMVNDALSLEIEREELPKKLQELSDLLAGGKDAEVELAYHVVAELAHVLKMENPAQRTAALSIFQDMVATTVFFLDTCENSHRDSDPAKRIEFAKDIVKTQMVQALSKADIFLA